MLISQARAYRRKKFRLQGTEVEALLECVECGTQICYGSKEIRSTILGFFGLLFLWDAAGVQERVSGTVCIE